MAWPPANLCREWVLPTASWRVSLPAGTCEILSTTTGGYLQPGWLFSVTRYGRWSNAHKRLHLRSVWEVILWPTLCNCKALGTEGKMETTYLALLLLPILLALTPPKVILVQPYQLSSDRAYVRLDGKFLMCNVESQWQSTIYKNTIKLYM